MKAHTPICNAPGIVRNCQFSGAMFFPTIKPAQSHVPHQLPLSVSSMNSPKERFIKHTQPSGLSLFSLILGIIQGGFLESGEAQ